MSQDLNRPSSLGAYRYAVGVITDTHVNENEDQCSSPFDVNRRANRRMRHVVRALNARDLAFVVHVGDLIHPVPSLGERYSQAAANFHGHVASLRHPLHLTPGNHDIGDKPNNWSPAASIRDAFVDMWLTHFGDDFHSFDHDGDHFVVINAQILNSGLEREARQKDWLERDLAAAAGGRIFLFSHYPPYFTSPDEVETYDNIGEPCRSWLLGLLERYRVEALFTGHVHNFWWNLHKETECYFLASTSFVRQDYSEMYRIQPGPDDEAGRNDRAKLGYAVLHVYEHGHTVEFVRSFGQEAAPDAGEEASPTFAPHRLHPRTAPAGALGFDMRQNWMEVVEVPPTGALDEFDRKEVRSDYPLMALWQLGVSHVRVPFRDLLVEANRERMRSLIHHGHRFTLFTFGEPNPLERKLIEEHQHIFASWEIGVNWSVFEAEAPGIGTFARSLTLPVYLSRLRSGEELREEAAGRYYHVINQGFLPADEAQMQAVLEDPALSGAIAGFVFRLTADTRPLDGIRAAADTAKRLGVKASVHLRMCGSNPSEAQVDDGWVSHRLAEAVVAAAAYPELQVFVDTFADIDRGFFVRNGVVDRLYNPRPAYHVVRHLTGLIGEAEGMLAVERVADEAEQRTISFSIGADVYDLVLTAADGVTLASARLGEGMVLDLETSRLARQT